jgi:hypothetical protein
LPHFNFPPLKNNESEASLVVVVQSRPYWEYDPAPEGRRVGGAPAGKYAGKEGGRKGKICGGKAEVERGKAKEERGKSFKFSPGNLFFPRDRMSNFPRLFFMGQEKLDKNR